MVKRYKTILIFILVFIAVFAFDQWVKSLTLSGLRWQSEYLDLTYALNTGVAFSMFSFLEHYLKYLHLALILALVICLLWQNQFLRENLVAFGMMLGAGCSNLLDRFIHGGVVDMFFWHKWFHFAIFNFFQFLILIDEQILTQFITN